MVEQNFQVSHTANKNEDFLGTNFIAVLTTDLFSRIFDA